jgi:Nuclease subunit of the excinuclease complex
MHHEIVKYLRTNPGASSVLLAEEFLKFKSPSEKLAHVAITGILCNDARCFYGDDGLWYPARLSALSTDTKTIRETQWHAVHVLAGAQKIPAKIFHVSVWSIVPSPTLESAVWLENPNTLSHEERLSLISNHDRPYNPQEKEAHLIALAHLHEQGIPVMLSARHHALLRHEAAAEGILFTDDIIVLSHLFYAANMPVPRPFSLENSYRALFDRGPILSDAVSYGTALAQCAVELFERLEIAGITTLADLEEALRREIASFDFSGREFSYDDIVNCPVGPGVYAFKDTSGAFLYIGKASSLRRRIMGYFQSSEESPEKLAQLRKDAHFLTTSVCGSELESLIYEYRLICKHTPRLNKKIGINERKGQFRPINDCMVLLPHADADKGMSFWFRRNQKIILKPFPLDFNFSSQLRQDLENFFFSEKLPPAPTDFPEQEIVYRWLRQHEGDLVSIPVDRMKNTGEVLKAVKEYWQEVKK